MCVYIYVYVYVCVCVYIKCWAFHGLSHSIILTTLLYPQFTDEIDKV